jgi:HSP20 family protein
MSTLIPWRGEVERLRNEMERLYGRFFDLRPFRRLTDEGDWVPYVDVSETPQEVIVKAEIPGMEAKDIDVSYERGVLTIKGERKREREEQEENYHRMERSYGSFFRSVRLPVDVDPEKVKATYKKGVLKINLAKMGKEAGRKIEVSAG